MEVLFNYDTVYIFNVWHHCVTTLNVLVGIIPWRNRSIHVHFKIGRHLDGDEGKFKQQACFKISTSSRNILLLWKVRKCYQGCDRSMLFLHHQLICIAIFNVKSVFEMVRMESSHRSFLFVAFDLTSFLRRMELRMTLNCEARPTSFTLRTSLLYTIPFD